MFELQITQQEGSKFVTPAERNSADRSVTVPPTNFGGGQAHFRTPFAQSL